MDMGLACNSGDHISHRRPVTGEHCGRAREEAGDGLNLPASEIGILVGIAHGQQGRLGLDRTQPSAAVVQHQPAGRDRDHVVIQQMASRTAAWAVQRGQWDKVERLVRHDDQTAHASLPQHLVNGREQPPPQLRQDRGHLLERISKFVTLQQVMELPPLTCEAAVRIDGQDQLVNITIGETVYPDDILPRQVMPIGRNPLSM